MVNRDIESLKEVVYSSNDLHIKASSLLQIIDLKRLMNNKNILFDYLQLIFCISKVDDIVKKEDNDKLQFLSDNYSCLYNLLKPLEFNNVVYSYNDYTTIDNRTSYDILCNFFKSIGNNLSDHFNMMVSEGRILFNSINKDNSNRIMLLPFEGKSYIIINKLKDISDMCALAHEVGHSYFCSINRCSQESVVEPWNNLKSEIPSSILELMFINYLLDNNLYVNDAFAKLIDFNSKISSNISIINYDYVDIYKFERLKYLLGRVYAKQIMIDRRKGYDISIDNLYTYFNKVSLNSLIKDIRLDYQEIINDIIENGKIKYQKSLKNKDYC